MKTRFFCLTLLFLLFLCQGNAQTTDSLKRKSPATLPEKGGKVNIGLFFAPTFDWMFPKNEGYFRSNIGINYRTGLNVNINLTHTRNYYVTTGLCFEQVGGELNFKDRVNIPSVVVTDSTTVYRKYRAQYITIPTAITLKTNAMHNVYLCANAGLYHSFLLRSFNSDGYMFGEGENMEKWTRDYRKSTDAAVLRESVFAGVGMELRVTDKFRTGLYVNYTYTLSNYFKGRGAAQNSITGENLKARMGLLEIVLNVNFF